MSKFSLNTSFCTMSLLIFFSTSIITSNAAFRRGSPSWGVDKDFFTASKASQYHIIGASRSGFYLRDDLEEDTDSKNKKKNSSSSSSSSSSRSSDAESSAKLVSCTRYGKRVKKSKTTNSH